MALAKGSKVVHTLIFKLNIEWSPVVRKLGHNVHHPKDKPAHRRTP
jgi:hypothetical protein